MATQERWSFPELQRQLNGALFERVALSPPKLAPVVREIHPEAATILKESYLLELLDLPPEHFEDNLQRGLVEQVQTERHAASGRLAHQM
jgi:predicted nuclease of restriction endonuclease-like (RecB) superfamily